MVNSQLKAMTVGILLLASPNIFSSEGGSDLELRLHELELTQQRLKNNTHEYDTQIDARYVKYNRGTTDISPNSAPSHNAASDKSNFGIFQAGGRGIKLADTPYGDVNFSAWAYLRYLNQLALDKSYSDAQNHESTIDRRHDIQLNKVNLYFKGWVYDPRFHYLFYTWTANTSQGQSAQVVVAGNMGYQIHENLSISGGIGALPGTRSLRDTFPRWLKVDARTIADEFFRPSYTTGVWLKGKFDNGINYKFMLGNNLSQLGVSASQLDNHLNTFSGSIWLMPSTGEYGKGGGFGDYEIHDTLATTVGLQFTRSQEDRQSQPGTEAIQNTQLRLSDGSVIFNSDAFGTVGRIDEATYTMVSIDAGMKKNGYSLSAEYYWRKIDHFQTSGEVPVDKLFDHGFQVQASMLWIPKVLQPYIAGSYIHGEYGKPWDIAIGLNWFPFRQQLLRVNSELLYLHNSPVGYSSAPFTVGANGPVFYTNIELMF